MDNYSYNSGIIPSFLQPNKIASQQASGSSYHGMHFTGNCFFRSIPEALGLHSRQIPTFMGSGSCNFNLLCFQEKEVVSHMQTSVGSRHGMHFIDNHLSDSGLEILSVDSGQPPTFEYYGPIEELENNLSEAMDDCFYSSNPNSMLGDLSVTTLHNGKSYLK